MQYKILGENKKTNDGRLVVKFRYWQDGKLKTVPRSELPTFYSKMDVVEHLAKIEKQYDSIKKIDKQREEWRFDNEKFDRLVKKYKEYLIKKAPRSYSGKMTYLNYYVMPFFIGIKNEKNLNNWFTHFDEYFKWLGTTSSYKNKERKLKPNSINHCVNECNQFLNYMAYLGECKIQPLCKGIRHAKRKSRKNLDSVFTDDESEALYQFLKNKNETYADAFWLLLKTGMRISELRGLNPTNVRKGVIPHDILNKLIERSEMGPYGAYLFFNFQVDGKTTQRSEKGISHVPLKGKDTDSDENIEESDTRYVPIWDSRAKEIIKKYMDIEEKKLKTKIHGDNIKQYSFFYDSVTSTILNFAFQSFYNKNKQYKRKTCHDCRHSYATWLGGHEISGILQTLICGHQEESAQRYNHLKSLMIKKAAREVKDLFTDWKEVS